MKVTNIQTFIHTFANQETNGIEEAEIKSGYWYKGNKLYVNSKCIAEVDFDKKLLFFSTYSSNGFSGWRLTHAFHSSFKYFQTGNLYITDARKEAFLNILERRKESVAALLDCSRGKCFSSGSLYGLSELEELDYDYESLDIIIDKVSYRHYKGWTSDGWRYFSLDKPCTIKEFLEIDWSEDLKIAEFKNWCYNYSSELPKNKEKRLELFENIHKRTEIMDLFAKNTHARLDREDQKKIGLRTKYLIDWKAGGKFYNELISINPTQLRLNGSLVETSKGARITVIEARKLYQIFKIALNGKVEIGGVFGGFRLHSIEKQENEWIMRIGCHVLHESVIEEFYPQIKQNDVKSM